MDATAEASSSINAEALFERVTDAVQSGTLDRAKLDECIRAGFDVNAVAPARGGLTVLHIAAIHAHPACIALLVAAGANVNARAASESGHTPLHCAANSHQENLACIAALLAATIATTAVRHVRHAVERAPRHSRPCTRRARGLGRGLGGGGAACTRRG